MLEILTLRNQTLADSTPEKIFDEQYSEYQDKIEQHANMFSFTNDIQNGILMLR